MRTWAAAAIFALCAGVGVSFAAVEGVAAHPKADAEKQQPTKKPGARPGANDTCRWAHDNECDEPGVGTGACPVSTDYSDCRYIRTGENDSCRWANDGECDEPGFGTGACVQGSDRTDCGNVTALRFQRDTCELAFNGVCDEPSGRCEARTDRRDCMGAERPMSINDHFFGRDDRIFVNRAEMPWRPIGQLNLDTGEMCTATLIAPDILITAAHCINTDSGPNAAGVFLASGPGGTTLEARVTAYYLDPRFNYRRFNEGDEIDGLDWALLRIDQRLGDQLGYHRVRSITAREADARAASLYQAGFSWDTGETLSGNVDCHIIDVNSDNTFAHECDTTRGDSGSAFMVRDGDGYAVIGVDSNFRSNPGGSFIYIAVSAASFERYVPDFTAGRIGRAVGASRGSVSKPRA